MSRLDEIFNKLSPTAQNSLKESLKNLELIRSKYYAQKQVIIRKSAAFTGFGAVITFLFFIMWFALEREISYVGFGGMVVGLIIMGISNNHQDRAAFIIKEYQSHFKYTLLDDCVKWLYPNLDYHPNHPLSRELYTKSQFQELLQCADVNSLENDDYFELKTKEGKIEFWDIKVRSASSARMFDFQGLFFIVEHPKLKKSPFWGIRSKSYELGEFEIPYQELKEWSSPNYQFFVEKNTENYPKYLQKLTRLLEQNCSQELLGTLLLSQDEDKLYIGFSHPRRAYEFFIDLTHKKEKNEEAEEEIETIDYQNQNANFFEPPSIDESLLESTEKQAEILYRMEDEFTYCMENLEQILALILVDD